MKINFVSFLDPFRFHGGGELDIRMLLEKGRMLGHDIRILSRVKHRYISRILPPVFDPHPDPDCWILADIFNVPEYGLKYPKGFLENIIHNEPYVHLDNAYVDICRRPALPCGGDTGKCPGTCGHMLTELMYSNSIVNFFLSPLHAETVNATLGNRYTDKSFVLRPLVSPDLFYNMNQPRDIRYIYVGTISNYKGYQLIRERFGEEKDFLFIGKNATGEELFGKHIEHIPNEELIHYLNRAVNFVHLPSWKEPMGRTIIEAALCGCNIISNEHVGACSFSFSISDPENIRPAAAEFWEKLDKLVLQPA